ncbi:tRNA-splicing endonuclease subunit Sen34 [Cuculus canorus]|uniref:tRNA-splicing endonuclease subunit Sen34 n=1 Tax=Cuculus canorus TaxID=55661 RepID=UPI0023AB19AB|nr:tRNA-splicing endonuclease subunit Sen34 [Cuculus canorus]
MAVGGNKMAGRREQNGGGREQNGGKAGTKWRWAGTKWREGGDKMAVGGNKMAVGGNKIAGRREQNGGGREKMAVGGNKMAGRREQNGGRRWAGPGLEGGTKWRAEMAGGRDKMASGQEAIEAPVPLPPLPPSSPQLVWDAGAARALRERHRLWGTLVGTPRGGAGPRLPLLLRPEEAAALRESGGSALLQTQEEANSDPQPPGGPTTPAPPLSPRGRPSPSRRLRAFRALWGRGLHVTGGGKFGGDLLVYPGPPERFHAAALLVVPRRSARLPLPALVAAARLGAHVRKTLALCDPDPGLDAGLALTSVQWRRDLAA